MSKVVVVRHAGHAGQKSLSQQQYSILLTVGLRALSGSLDIKAAFRQYFPFRHGGQAGVIGVKANCLARALNSTPVALADAFAELCVRAGLAENNLVIWDRTSHELQKAGFTLNASSFGRRCMGTDANGIGYSGDFHSFGEVDSLVSRILTDMVDFNLNLPVLKDHSIAGLSAGLKNMYGAIHNPNKYHGDNCSPFCAQVSNLEPIRLKNRLTIIDAIRVQYEGGPGFMEKYLAYYNGLIMSADPVAADAIGLEILERLRKVHGQPTLEQSGRPVRYLAQAQAIGLGVADRQRIDLQVIGVDDTGQQVPAELW
ncbi:MAG TPA: DUF362 domain-containing protein [Candidatus Deferrimicrobium sp.]|nr:DUF362 domain-containing protein [Candidatus Deferrimicrobium sp.]